MISKKKILRLIGTLFVITSMIISLCAFSSPECEYEINEPYLFEVLPGSQEWNDMTPQERKDACYIDEEIVEKMNTNALLETVLNYPYMCHIYVRGDIESGVTSVANTCPALAEFINREDAALVLENYIDRERELYEDNSSEKPITLIIANTLSEFFSRKNSVQPLAVIDPVMPI